MKTHNVVHIPPSTMNIIEFALKQLVEESMTRPEDWSVTILYRYSTEDMAFFLVHNDSGEKVEVIV